MSKIRKMPVLIFFSYLAPVRGWGSFRRDPNVLNKIRNMPVFFCSYLAPARGWGSMVRMFLSK